MPYLGRPVTNAGQFEIIDDISSSFNGSTTSFTLQVNGTNIQPDVSNVIITLDGVTQIPASAYSITGSTINFTEAPPSSTAFNGILAGQSQFIESDFITNTHIKSTANISGSKINTDFSAQNIQITHITSSGNISGSSTSNISAGTFTGVFNGAVSSSVLSSPSQGTVRLATNGTNTDVDTGLQSGDSPTFAGGTVTGNFSVGGTLTAQEIHTEFTSASITFTSGSHKFGDSSDDVHTMTGSLNVSGAVNLNDGDLSVIDSVGIGTNNPTVALEVYGSADQQIRIDSTANRAQLQFDGKKTSDAEFAEINFANDGDSAAAIHAMRDGANDAARLAFFTQATGGSVTERMSVDSTGNVGIGTSNPSEKLHIYNSDHNWVFFDAANGKSAGAKYAASAGSAGFFVGDYSSYKGNFSFYDANKTGGAGVQLLIQSGSGNVGIGTTSPLSPLHINKVITQVSSSAQSKTQAGFYLNSNPTYGSNSLTMFEMSSSVSTAGTYGIQISNSNGTSQYPLALNPYGGNIGIGTGSPQSQVEISNTAEASLAIIGTRGVGGGDATLYLVENTKAYGIRMRYDGGDDKLYINADEDTRNIMTLMRSNGNVGIGTTTPDQTLHVHKGSAGSIASTSDSVLTLENNGTAVLQFLTPNSNSNQIRFGDPQDNGSGYIDYSHSTNALTFGTAGPEKMRIDSSGRVGIGTVSPSGSLHVQAANPTVYITNTTQDGASTLLRMTEKKEVDGDAGGFLRYVGSNNWFELGTNISGTDTVHIYLPRDGSGRVGIGDSSPSAPLEVGSTGMGSMGYTGTLIAAASASATEYAQGSSATWGPSVAVSNTDTSSTRTGAAMKFVHRGSSSGVAAIVSTSAAADRGDLRFITRGAGNVIDEKVQITEDGYLLSHKLPAFHAYGFAAHVYANSADRDPLKYNSTHYNQGSHYSTSTGKFTAPINGIYFFAMSAMYRHVGGDFHVGIKVNNTSKTISNDHQEYQASGFAGDGDLHTWVQTQSTLVASLAANDYVTCYMGSSTNSGTYLYNSSNYNHFCGFLVG